MFSSMATVKDLKSQVDRLKLEVLSLKAETGADNISIGSFLLTRLAQLHVTVRIIPTCSPYHRCSTFHIGNFWCAW